MTDAQSMSLMVSTIQLVLTAIVAGVSAYFVSYLKAKGEKHAEIESIRRITEIQETIRHQNSDILESLNRLLKKSAHEAQYG